MGCSAPRVMGLVRGRGEQRCAAPLPQLAAAAASAYKALRGAGKAAPLYPNYCGRTQCKGLKLGCEAVLQSTRAAVAIGAC
eukprot:COSAG01_NODE_33168_length_568_cov_456.070362_2_plen_80_part_01